MSQRIKNILVIWLVGFVASIAIMFYFGLHINWLSIAGCSLANSILIELVFS